MRPKDRAIARKSLDQRLNLLRDSTVFARPPRGWVKAIREALGMTAAQLGARVGVSRPRIYEIEKSEISGSLSLDSLQRVANAMDCQLVYALVPRKPLDKLAQDKALKLATERLRNTAHSMTLEDQSVDAKNQAQHLQNLATEILEASGSALWDEL